MADPFEGTSDNILAPAERMFAIVPHATNEVPFITKAIRCNVGGTVALRSLEGTEDVSITMVAGELIAVRAKFVRVTGTTAVLHGLV